jgi:DNA-binding CsgD family transcriptional regulator
MSTCRGTQRRLSSAESAPSHGAGRDRAGRPVDVRPAHPGPALAATGLPASTPARVCRRHRGAAGSPQRVECLAHPAGEVGSHREAVRLFGAAAAVRQRTGEVCFKIHDADDEAAVAAVRDAMDEGDFDRAWAEGAALSVDEPVAYAQRGRGERKRPTSGWASLTPAERNVVRLVSKGLADKDIATRLFVSPRTMHTPHPRLHQTRNGPPAYNSLKKQPATGVIRTVQYSVIGRSRRRAPHRPLPERGEATDHQQFRPRFAALNSPGVRRHGANPSRLKFWPYRLRLSRRRWTAYRAFRAKPVG